MNKKNNKLIIIKFIHLRVLFKKNTITFIYVSTNVCLTIKLHFEHISAL